MKPGLFTFALTVFLSAFLLFLVQPLISRYILPWFGGTTAVWSVSLLFFQTLLLLGYWYAHRIVKHTIRQLTLHSIILVCSLIVLIAGALLWGAPLLPGDSWKPPDSSLPILRIIAILLISVGLPYFILSTTSPLLQAWFSTFYPARSPYRLYSLSNLGSFLALISYPFLFEPFFNLRAQSLLWLCAYLFFVGLSIFFIVKLRKRDNPSTQTNFDPNAGAIPTRKELPSSNRRKLLWLLYPTLTTILLLAATNQLTQEIAAIPFLWVLPLSIYLLSYTLTFAERNWYRPTLGYFLLGIALLLLSHAIDNSLSIGIGTQILIYSFFLLMATLVLHGELYKLRPDSNRLTSFYLLVAIGGVIGGIFVNFVAPFIFANYWELHIGAMLCWIIVILILIKDRRSIFHSRLTWIVSLFLLVVLGITSDTMISDIHNKQVGAVVTERNFYGVFRVKPGIEGDPVQDIYRLTHGMTNHGIQFTDEKRRMIPTSYYGPNSGIGLTIRNYPHSINPNLPNKKLKVGVVGLGIGTLAAYGYRGDIYRFYEINPDIITLAKGDGGLFTYLQDSHATIEVVSGDARISLEQEAKNDQLQAFDILAIDAFNSDSIPVHLLTKEAFEVYLQHLKPDSVLAFHTSNRFLELEPLVYLLADHFGYNSVLISSSSTNSGGFAANWVLVTKNQAFLELPQIVRNLDEPEPEKNNLRMWTDDYSNLFACLRMDEFFRIK